MKQKKKSLNAFWLNFEGAHSYFGVLVFDTFLVPFSLTSVLWLPICGNKVVSLTTVAVVNKMTIYFVGGTN
jgi:hypothetical protein